MSYFDDIIAMKNGHIAALERDLRHLREDADGNSCALRNADLERQLAAAQRRSSELFDELGVAQNSAQTQIGELTRQLAEMTADRDNLRQLIEASDAGPLFERLDAQHVRIAELEHVLRIANREVREYKECVGSLHHLTAEQRERIAYRIAINYSTVSYPAGVTAYELKRAVLAAIAAEVCGPVTEEE